QTGAIFRPCERPAQWRQRPARYRRPRHGEPRSASRLPAQVISPYSSPLAAETPARMWGRSRPCWMQSREDLFERLLAAVAQHRCDRGSEGGVAIGLAYDRHALERIRDHHRVAIAGGEDERDVLAAQHFGDRRRRVIAEIDVEHGQVGLGLVDLLD